jgi:hypothetical protein
MTARLSASLILIFTFSFVFVLLRQGYDLTTALFGAGAGGVVAVEIARRLLGGTGGPGPSGFGAWKIDESIEEFSRVFEPSMVAPEHPQLGSVSGGQA